jgi:hypothetical protein
LRTNYVLIDYENVQPEALSVLDADHFKVLVFVGASQAKVAFETADALQRMGNKADYIKISGNGSNALDFHIAFYIGQLAASDPTAFFHIISKDTGFDPLIKHLKSRKLFAARISDVSEISLVKIATTKLPTDKIAAIVANLHQRGLSKPRTVKTLLSTVSSLFQKQLSEQELAELLKDLEDKSYIVINGAKVSYALPAHTA